jgi:hypothetical protein
LNNNNNNEESKDLESFNMRETPTPSQKDSKGFSPANNLQQMRTAAKKLRFFKKKNNSE